MGIGVPASTHEPVASPGGVATSGVGRPSCRTTEHVQAGTHGIELQRFEFRRVHAGGVVLEVQRRWVRRDVHHGEPLLVHLRGLN